MDVLLDKIFNDDSTLDTTLSLLSLQNSIYQTLTKKSTADLIPPAGWEVCRKLYPDYGIGLRPPEAIGWHYCIEPAKGVTVIGVTVLSLIARRTLLNPLCSLHNNSK